MRDHLDAFATNGLPSDSIAAVTFADPSLLAGHRAHLGLEFPILADPDRTLYSRFGLSRASLLRVYNPGTIRLYASLLRKGRQLRRPTEDTRQLGGDFLIDANGRLASGFWPTSPDDRPTVHQLLAAVRDLRFSDGPPNR